MLSGVVSDKEATALEVNFEELSPERIGDEGIRLLDVPLPRLFRRV